MKDAEFHLTQGDEFPYDGTDAFKEGKESVKPATDWAHRAARGVIHNLSDRRGIKNGFHDIDEAVRLEIVDSLAEIVREAYTASIGEQND